MYGDFSRNSFDACRNYTRVLMQQGRPLTDSDWNEQAAILSQREWNLIQSLLGANHGTFDEGFFPNIVGGKKLELCPGSYYVDGLRCEFTKKADSEEFVPKKGPLLFFLEVWEESVNPLVDETLLDPALSPIDTTWRSRVVWRACLKSNVTKYDCRDSSTAVGVSDPSKRTLRIRRTPSATSQPTPACDSLENTSIAVEDAVYRIEVHRTGKPFKFGDASFPQKDVDVMGFKWSKENGAAVYPVKSALGRTLEIDDSRFVSRLPLRANDCLELRDQSGRSVNRDRALVSVISFQRGRVEIADEFAPLENEQVSDKIEVIERVPELVPAKHARFHLQRWNHSGTRVKTDSGSTTIEKENAELVTSRAKQHQMTLNADGSAIAVADNAQSENVWLELEHGIQIRFEMDVTYSEGDYWLVRTSPTSPTGFSSLLMNCQLDQQPTQTSKTSPDYLLRLSGHHHHVAFGLLKRNDDSNWSWCPGENAKIKKEFSEICWNGKTLDDRTGPIGCTDSKNSCVPCQKPTDKPATDGPADALAPSGGGAHCSIPAEPRMPLNPVSLLSGEGARALKGYLSSPKDVTRRVPARYLSYEPQSDVYRRFRSPLLVSEILEASFEKYLAKIERCIDVSEAERALVEADARADYALAAEFQSLVSSGQGFRPLIA